MTDVELNATAEGIFLHLANMKGATPLDGITITGVVLLKIYEQCQWNPRPPIEKFAKDIHDGLLTTWKMRSATAPTSERLQ